MWPSSFSYWANSHPVSRQTRWQKTCEHKLPPQHLHPGVQLALEKIPLFNLYPQTLGSHSGVPELPLVPFKNSRVIERWQRDETEAKSCTEEGPRVIETLTNGAESSCRPKTTASGLVWPLTSQMM